MFVQRPNEQPQPSRSQAQPDRLAELYREIGIAAVAAAIMPQAYPKPEAARARGDASRRTGGEAAA